MVRKLVFAKEKNFRGWKCSVCGWTKPIGRLADFVGEPVPSDLQAEFDAHACEKFPAQRRQEDFSEEATRIVKEVTEDR